MDKLLSQLSKLKQLRQFLLQQVAGLRIGQLNQVPPGYNNNIIWHLGHLLSAVQGVCYVRAGLPIAIDERYFTPYLSGTRPARFIEELEVNELKALSISSLDQLGADIAHGLFRTYSPSERIAAIYGVEVASIADALDFLLFHEGYHIGYVVAMKHLV